MAVVVQRLVAAEVSGVLFTQDPLDRDGGRMLVEAAWGLGESVVSGRVTPDRYHLDRQTGEIVERQVNLKPTLVTAHGEERVPEIKQRQPCLDDAQLASLAELGRRIEAFYGEARDVEWAWGGGRFWVLQARPITTAGAAEREHVRRDQIAALAARAEPGGTVWSRYNLAEILPEPTPMTWAVVQRLLSGHGGMGLMYRDLGFAPDPSLAGEGVYELVCGRPYCNLSREPRMQHAHLPLEHNFAELRADPSRALYPRAKLNAARAGWRLWLRLPMITLGLLRSARQLERENQTFGHRFRTQVLPSYLLSLEKEAARDLANAADADLVARLESTIRLTLHDFAREGLKATVLGGAALGELERVLTRTLEPSAAGVALAELTVGVRPDPEADLPAAIWMLQDGEMSVQDFLRRFGHRGNQEMELSRPRWEEAPDVLSGLLGASAARRNTPVDNDHLTAAWERITREAGLGPAVRDRMRKRLNAARDFLGLRETAKHYLMKGYALIRRILVMLDRRYRLEGGIFFLTPQELPRLISGDDLSAVIADRRRRRAVALSLEVPQVLFSDDLETIDRTRAIAGADSLQGVGVSAGVGEGPALVLNEPEAVPPGSLESYILVCPSTDPAWVPLFMHASGLVMEVGGILSHGAIVAREFGLPAVAGLPDVRSRLQTGQRLRVDGTNGTVTILEPAKPSFEPAVTPARYSAPMHTTTVGCPT